MTTHDDQAADLAVDTATHAAVIAAAIERQDTIAVLKTLSSKSGEYAHGQLEKKEALEEKIVNLKEKYQAAVDAVGPGGHTPLLLVCMQGSVDVISALLALGADPEEEGDVRMISHPTEKYKLLPLTVAARDGHTKIMMLLVEVYGVDVNQATLDRGWTALSVACGSGAAASVEWLLARNGIEVNKTTRFGATPLFMACQNGHIGVTELLLAHSGTDVHIAPAGAGTVYFNTPLAVACQNGHAGITKLLLAHDGIAVNVGCSDGATPLLLACQDGHALIVKLLLAHEGVEVNKADDVMEATPLHTACQGGYDAVVKLLLAHEGIHVNKATTQGATSLLIACQNGHAETIKLLLAHDGIAVNVGQSGDGPTPLLVACQDGFAVVVKLLLAYNGIEVNKATDKGATSLYSACYNGQAAIVKLLLSHEGIEVNKAMVGGATPLFIACKKGHVEIVKLLMAHDGIEVSVDTDVTPLILACDYGDAVILKLLLSHEGIDHEMKKTMFGGATPLLMACQKGHAEITNLLLAHGGIDVNKATEVDGVTPLAMACQNEHAEIVALLLAHNGIEVNKATIAIAGGNSADTPLIMACRNGNPVIVKLLLAHDGIEVDEALLIMACQSKHPEIVKLLLAYGGIDVNAENADCRFPLLLACHDGSAMIVKLLLSHEGIEVNNTTDQGFTPLYIACHNGEVEIVKLLLAHEGIKVNTVTAERGLTPLYVACVVSKNSAIVKLLLSNAGTNVNHQFTNEHMHGGTVLDDLVNDTNTDNLPMIQLLIVYGASYDTTLGGIGLILPAKNTWLKFVSGWSRLQIAAGCRMHSDAALLLQQGRIDPDDPATTSVKDIIAVIQTSRARVHSNQLQSGERETGPCTRCRKAGARLRCSRCKGVQYCNVECQRNDWKHGRHKADCIALAEAAAKAPRIRIWENAPQICKATIKLVADATRGWHRTTHWLHHKQLRNAVFAVLVVVGRLKQKEALQYKDEHKGDEVGEDEVGEEEDALPVLPIELWFHALGFMKRSWWAVKE